MNKTKAIMRDVIRTQTRSRKSFAPGGFVIINILNCGHEVSSKGSAGFAKKKRCHQCERLKDYGGHSTTGNIRETWDSTTNMPKREKIK